MVEDGKLSGEYNLITSEEIDLYDHRIPIEEFITRLRDNDVPSEVCVVGLENVLGNDEIITELSTQITDSSSSLENLDQLPTIQFAIDGAFQRRNRDFEVETGDDLYRLKRIFGPQINRRKDGWLTVPF